MGKQRAIAGCLVLQEAAASEWRHYKVVLCEMPVSPEATEETHSYAVWHIDHEDKPSEGAMFKTQTAAQAEYNRRT